MSRTTRFTAPLIAVMMLSSAPLIALAQNAPATNNTPAATAEAASVPGTVQAQQGFRDGLEAAKLDKLANRKIDAKVSHLYVHPPVKGNAVEEYRTAFQTGYDAAVKHGVEVVRAIPTGGM